MQTILTALPAFSGWLIAFSISLIVIGLPLRRHAQQNLLRIRGSSLAPVTQTNEAQTAGSSSQTNKLDIKGANHAPIVQSNTQTAPPSAAESRWTSLSRVADVLQVAGFAILMLQIAKIIT